MTPDPAAPAPPPASPAPEPVALRLEQGDALALEELVALPLFEGLPKGRLKLNVGGVARRRLRKGEVICRQGDYGASAFFLERGAVEVFLESQVGRVEKSGGGRGLFRRLTSVLLPTRPAAPDEVGPRFIPVDAPVDLDRMHPVARIEAGELFGEMACLTNQPRAATVRAASDEVVVIEMLRSVLLELRNSPRHKERVLATYRARALDQHLQNVPFLAGLSREFVDRLRPRVKLLQFEPKQVIFKEGDPADGLFLVGMGFVKVAKSWAGGEFVLSYLPRGSCFGEMALLSDTPRSATCSALDHVDVVKIETEDFRAMLAEFPAIRERIEALARQRTEQNAAIERRAASADLEEFLAQGLLQAQNLLLLDLDKCTRCDECVRGCASAHGGVTRLIRDGLRFDHHLVATSCRSCRDPVCMPVCPVAAILRNPSSLEVVIKDWCIGCRKCAEACPYGNINMVDLADPGQARQEADPRAAPAKAKLRATTCDLCMSHGQPACVSSCPHDAAHRVDPLVFFRDRIELLDPEASSRVRGG